MNTTLFSGVQQLGRSLMLPIAVLPIAGLLLRLGQPDLLDVPFIATAGDAIFSNLGLLFAIGVAVGFAKENHGAAALAGAVGFFITIEGAKTIIGIPPAVVADLVGPAKALAEVAFQKKLASKMSVPAGILTGLIAGAMYNRFKDIKLPEYLAFFGGRRFVPIATGFACLFLAAGFGYGWLHFEAGLDALSKAVFAAGEVGLFLYGVLNRILIVTGLHHIINNLAWFILGDFQTSGGAVVTGDLKRFFAGDASAGMFMAGFFPVMMFGLPGACLAMYHTARADKRAQVGGVLFSMALTAFLTGVTEPVEFAFMFLAPALYALHAILTGVSMVVMDVLNVKLGFGFSAGLFDYILNFKLATNPWLLLPVGAVYFAVYYVVFRFCIVRFNLMTLGREDDAPVAVATAGAAPAVSAAPVQGSDRDRAMLAALGGSANIRSLDSCTTRLRLTVANSAVVDDAGLKALGVRGVLKPTTETVQVIIGPEAELVADRLKALL